MKKYLFLAILFLPLFVKAQYSDAGTATDPTNRYIFVGSLTQPENASSNYEKLQVEVFGGGWGSASLGITTFLIANRGGLAINRTTTGSEGGWFELVAFSNSGVLDFYIKTISWTAIAYKSFKFGAGYNPSALIGNNVISTTPPGTVVPLTSVIKSVLITDDAGNIGIGTPTPDPSYKLSVNGEIRTKEIVVETGWADYVFDNSYKLPSLTTVEKYVKSNHHLPGVPTAAEVERNGVKVGEASAILLKKIEELTLYLIEKDKEIKRLTKQQSQTSRKQQRQIDQLTKQVNLSKRNAAKK